MISQTFAIGTGNATAFPELSQDFTSPKTPPSKLSEVLDIIAAHGDKNLPMLRTTAVRLSEFTNTAANELSLDVLVDVRSKFSDYLKGRRYAPNSIRTYRQNTQRLLRWAERLGWVSGKLSVEESWRPILSALAKKPRAYTSIIYYAIQIDKTPSEFGSGSDVFHRPLH